MTKSNDKTFAPGDRVTIFQTRHDGSLCIEGDAKIIGPCLGVANYYNVEFIEDEFEPAVCRFVYPAGQANPVEYVARINEE